MTEQHIINEDQTLEIAERVLLLESQIEALKDAILRLPNAPTPERLDQKLFEFESRSTNQQKRREKSDEFQRLIRGQDDPATLIRLLHDHVLYRVRVPQN